LWSKARSDDIPKRNGNGGREGDRPENAKVSIAQLHIMVCETIVTVGAASKGTAKAYFTEHTGTGTVTAPADNVPVTHVLLPTLVMTVG
jgi:hypothetical protein